LWVYPARPELTEDQSATTCTGGKSDIVTRMLTNVDTLRRWILTGTSSRAFENGNTGFHFVQLTARAALDQLEAISSRTLTEERKQKLFGKAIAFCIIDVTKPTTKNGTAAKCAINCTAPAGYGGGYPHPTPYRTTYTVTRQKSARKV